MPVCKHCHLSGEGKYCSHCGEIYQPYRITIPSILHEVLHTFTHADTGFLYTLKNLAIHPVVCRKFTCKAYRYSFNRIRLFNIPSLWAATPDTFFGAQARVLLVKSLFCK